MLNKCISISYDWISLYCFLLKPLPTILPANLTIVKQKYTTQVYRDVHIIYENNEEIATITSAPLSPLLAPESCIIKFSNKLCYEPNLHNIIKNYLAILNLSFSSISRLDICADFPRFANNLLCGDFINKFISGKILKLTKSTWKIYGTQRKQNTYNQISFGSASSWLGIKLYNKYLEQNQVAVKPWLIDKCRNTGIDITTDFWRLEFSLKTTDRKLIDEDGTIIYDAKELDIINYSNVSNQFYRFLSKHFVFVRNTNISKKDRMPRIELLKFDASQTEILRAPQGAQGNRSDKIFAKKYYNLALELAEVSPTMQLFAAQTLSDFIDRHGLESWAAKKGILETATPTQLLRQLAASYLADCGKPLILKGELIVG
jgi:hypothetical protein